MANRLYNCPECGSETVVDTTTIMGVTYEEERCNGLIETSPDKPLDACMWSQELRMIANGICKE